MSPAKTITNTKKNASDAKKAAEHPKTQEAKIEEQRAQDLIILGEIPVNAIEVARKIAAECRPIIEQTSSQIGKKKYVQVEGWQTIANAHGCVLSSRDVERIDGGYRAIGEVRRLRDGAVLATAEGFLGDDEVTWKGRPEYARRAMAQTRAMSRAGRSAFAYVLVLMNADFATTPYEEMPADEAEGASYGSNASESDREKARELVSQARDLGRITENAYNSWIDKIGNASRDTLPAMMRTLTQLAERR